MKKAFAYSIILHPFGVVANNFGADPIRSLTGNPDELCDKLLSVAVVVVVAFSSLWKTSCSSQNNLLRLH